MSDNLRQRWVGGVTNQCKRLILMLASVAIFQVQTKGDPGSQKAHNKLRITAGTQVVLLLSSKLNGKGNRPSPSIIVVQDVVIDGVTVIAAGAPAQISIILKPPGLFNMPGKVGFDVTSIPTISGELIAVRALQTAQGEPPCLEWDCLSLPLLFWKHGDPGHIDRELLLSATVIETVDFNRDAFPASRGMLASQLARLHIYSLTAGGNTRQGAGLSPVHLHSMAWFLDGKRMDTLTDFTYACTLISPGSHSVRIDKDEFQFETNGINEYHLRITYLTPESQDKVIEETRGYEFEGAVLTPGRLGKRGVSCFDPLDTVVKARGQKNPGKLDKTHQGDSSKPIP